MRKVLGVNISHNCSFAYFEDNVLKEYYEEDRFNKMKYFIPEQGEDDYKIKNGGEYTYQYFSLKKFKNINFDMVVFASSDRGHIQIEMPIIKNILSQVNCKEYFFTRSNHHIYHALCGYYYSGFDEALVLVSDGGGEGKFNVLRAIQSIFLINKKEIKPKYKLFTSHGYTFFDYKERVDKEDVSLNGIDCRFINFDVCARKYFVLRIKAGFEKHQEGQLMGIAAYKDKGTNLDKKVLEIADRAQKETLEEFCDLMERAKKYSDCKNIVLSGGYHLNCANNFKIIKRYPEYNFFVDPNPYDGGTSVGAAYYENYL